MTDYPSRFLLSMDELHLLETHCVAVVLPSEFRTEWGAETSEVERAARSERAEQSLIVRGLLAVSPDPDIDWTGRLPLAFSTFLAFFSDPAMIVSVHAWDRGRTWIQTVAIVRGFAVSLVRSQRLNEAGIEPRNEDAVELSAYSISHLVPELLRTFVAVDSNSTSKSAVQPHRSIILPLTVAQGIIQAIRTGRPEMVEAVAREANAFESVSLLEEVAFSLDCGFSVVAHSLVADDQVARHWFRSPDGWFELAVESPDVSAQTSSVEFVDSSRVQVASSNAAAVVAALTITVGFMTGAFHV